MNRERYDRIKSIFNEAAERSGREREAWLRTACGDDEELRREVEALLDHDSTADDAFDESAIERGRSNLAAMVDEVESGGGAVPPHGAGAPLPRRIGNYDIVRQVGGGGMGLVYEAVQRTPQRTVALKIVRPDLTSLALVRRFRFEAEALGQLRHPGVAHVYEAGTADVTTSLGTTVENPFLAMELIDGVRIDDYVAKHRLGTRDRLELVAKVCDAAHHAHQHGVIHRDLKPSNILVESSGQPKILDFGVARLVDADKHLTTLQTEVGRLVGTISYMSPEQLSGDNRNLDTQTDVYALGVILYELLSGRLPYDVRGRSLVDAARIRQDEEPTSLSVVEPSFRGDVETIVRTALERDKQQRYSSAAELAGDIRRYLRDEPIVARPPSARYLLGKFVRRNRMLVGGAALLALVMVAASVVSVSQAVRARRAESLAQARLADALTAQAVAERERQEADNQAAIATAINEFLNDDLLAAVHPASGNDRDVRMRSVLDIASERLDERFADQPVVKASIHETLGTTYMGLGDYARSVEHIEQAVELRAEGLGPEAPLTLESTSWLANLYRRMGRYDESQALFDRVLPIQRRVLTEKHPDLLATLNNLAILYERTGRFEDAEVLYVEALDGYREVYGMQREDTLNAMNNLGLVRKRLGRLDEAERLFLEAIRYQREYVGETHPATLNTITNLANLYDEQMRYDEAEATYRDVLVSLHRVLGAEHPETLRTEQNFATFYYGSGRYADAERLLETVVAGRRKALGDDNPETLLTLGSLARAQARIGRYEQAEANGAESLHRLEKVVGESHHFTVSVGAYLTEIYVAMGNLEKARSVIARVVRASSDRYGADHLRTWYLRAREALVAERMGLLSEAEQLAQQIIDALGRASSGSGIRIARTRTLLAEVYLLQGRAPDAEPVARSAVSELEGMVGARHPYTLRARTVLGAVLLESGDAAAARQVLAAASSELQDAYGPTQLLTMQAQCELARAECALGSQARAVQALKDVARRAASQLPEGHWFVPWTRACAAACLIRMQPSDEAAVALRAASADLAACLGEKHPRTQRAREWLSMP